MPIQYYQFWESFYGNDFFETDRFFQMLLSGYQNEDMQIISVFGTRPWDGERSSGLTIAWSGEEHCDTNTERYDVNLIMRTTDLEKRIICMPLFIMTSYVENLWPMYAVPRPLLNLDTRRFCLFVISNAQCWVRNHFFLRLSNRYKRVDSCGPAFNNTGFLAPRPREQYFQFIGQYKFMICFENSNQTPEYLTEKLHNAWAGGAIPIYWGASKALEWLNPKAFLYLQDDSEEGMDQLIEKIARLDQDEEAYRRMHAQPLLLDGKIPRELSLEHIRECMTICRENINKKKKE